MGCAVRGACLALGIELHPMYTDAILDEVDALLTTAAETGETNCILDEIKRTLEAASIAWYGDCPPERAGVSPHNRSKLGVVGADSQYLGKDILDDGWSWRKTSDSSAFEMPPAPHDKEAIEYNDA